MFSNSLLIYTNISGNRQKVGKSGAIRIEEESDTVEESKQKDKMFEKYM